MANRAYLSVWCRDWSEARQLEFLVKFLATAPASAKRLGFTRFLVRAVGPEETPLLDCDLRSAPYDAVAVGKLAAEYVHDDCAFEVETRWDLWVFEAGRWNRRPWPLELSVIGQQYDGGAWQEHGHLQADIGFEHLFTGHGGLLASAGRAPETPQDPVEAEFVRAMTEPGNLGAYREKTRENIRQLYQWLANIERVLPVERSVLWSEGEENFEARLEEILATR